MYQFALLCSLPLRVPKLLLLVPLVISAACSPSRLIKRYG
jgi:hypothetical protein